jgi:hypothetical protein
MITDWDRKKVPADFVAATKVFRVPFLAMSPGEYLE